MKSKRRAPRFRKGQMVVLVGPNSRTDYGRRVERINRFIWHGVPEFRYQVSGAHADDGGWMEDRLRPLTKRERGPERRKGK